MPDVSVIMNCRNGEPFVADAIGSVLTQTFDSFEIVFWDNQSTDRSADIARAAGPKLRYFRSAVPMTLGQARNAALAEARGTYVAVLDADDSWLSGKLAAQVALIERQPDTGLVYCDSERMTASGVHIARWSEERRFRRGRVLEPLLTCCFISMSTILMRRSVLDAVGVFNPAYGQVEEWDLYLRIAARYAIDYVDDVLVRETIHTSNASRNYDQVADETCTMLREWASRSPAHATVCRRQIAAARFRQACVQAYRATRARRAPAVVGSGLRCAALAMRHPVTVGRMLAQYLNASNRRMFMARFS